MSSKSNQNERVLITSQSSTVRERERESSYLIGLGIIQR
jgi:hypothetical protein